MILESQRYVQARRFSSKNEDRRKPALACVRFVIICEICTQRERMCLFLQEVTG